MLFKNRIYNPDIAFVESFLQTGQIAKSFGILKFLLLVSKAVSSIDYFFLKHLRKNFFKSLIWNWNVHFWKLKKNKTNLFFQNNVSNKGSNQIQINFFIIHHFYNIYSACRIPIKSNIKSWNTWQFPDIKLLIKF